MAVIIGVVLLAAALIALAYGVVIYNGLVSVKNDVMKAWSNIDVILKQRHDELPKLISVCESYMQYEKKTLAQIVELRANAQRAETIAAKAVAEGELSGAIGKLFALAENYPELKAQQSFQFLQQRISGLESQIADLREFYNESVNNYNIRIESLPDALVANAMNLRPQVMFQVSDEDRQDVNVKINVA